MVRTQIQLPEEQHRRLREWAARHRISLAEAVRRCVAGHLDAAPGVGCKVDSDCTKGANGRCSLVYSGGPEPWCSFTYDACFVDATCPKDQVCVCRGDPVHAGPFGHYCKGPGGCKVDADCGPPGWCSPSHWPGCTANQGWWAYHCHTPADECVDDSDCPKGACGLDPELGRWVCGTFNCVG